MKPVGPKELVAMLRRFQDRKEYAALKRSCTAAVTQWRWATGLMLPQLPYDDIVSGWKAKWVKKQPRFGWLHGLDAGGRIRCIRNAEQGRPDEEVYEQFLIYEDGGFWCIYFGTGAEKAPLGAKWFEMDGDRWLRSLEIGHNGIHEQALHWEGDRFTGYTWRIWDSVSVGKVKPAAVAKLREEDADRTVYAYSYAADGELERVTADRDVAGKHLLSEVKYQCVPKGVSLESLLEEAEDMLVAEIPRTIRAAKVKQTVYGLLIQFTGVDTDPDGYAPPLFLPTEALRRRVLEQRPREAASYLWAAVEWEGDPDVVSLHCNNTALDEKLHLIFQLTITQPSRTNYGPVRKMFQRVCARLNALDWQGTLKPTDDFIVVPFDTHGEFDLNADLKASVPAERLRLLIERGRLGRMKLK
jgi:hypothetical protein